MEARTRLPVTASVTISVNGIGVGPGVGVTMGLVAVAVGAAVSTADEDVFARASTNRTKQNLFFMGGAKVTMNGHFETTNGSAIARIVAKQTVITEELWRTSWE
ncbi:MAG TPA: hypothetical protein VN952_08560 [Chthoniobacterales bacterium]|nr:hypothetical protein [Chthoniobacterales bacterium]